MLIPLVLCRLLVFLGRDERGLKGGLIAVAIRAAWLVGFAVFRVSPYLFVADQAFLDAVLILVIFGGDVRIRCGSAPLPRHHPAAPRPGSGGAVALTGRASHPGSGRRWSGSRSSGSGGSPSAGHPLPRFSAWCDSHRAADTLPIRSE